MPTLEEKAAFARRLALALRRSAEPVRGATELALRFNLRHAGTPVSAQTAHKWLSGRAIPTSDKLGTLAAWLGVTEHWLHYGPPPGGGPQAAQSRAPYRAGDGNVAHGAGAGKPSAEAISLALKIQMLPPQSRYLIEELVGQLQAGPD